MKDAFLYCGIDSFYCAQCELNRILVMVWTIVAVLLVLGVKFVTSLRLKDLKAKLEAIQPKIDELRTELPVAEDELESLKIKEEATQTRLTHLKGIVSYLENQIKAPDNTAVLDERQNILEAATEEPA